jgi:uncharacterized protein YoxC
MLDLKNATEPDAPKKKSKPETSGPNGGVRVDHNGKINVTMNAAMLGLLATLVFKVWTTFTQMHTDVNEAKGSLGDLVLSVQKLEESVSQAVSSSQKNADDIEAVKAEKEKDAEAASEKSEEVAKRLEAIEHCIRKPKDCQL